MKFNIKKSAKILIKNPNIMLLLVSYLLIMASILPIVVFSYGRIVFFIFIILLFLFTCAFLAGWFGLVKSIVECKSSPYFDDDIKKRYEEFKNSFFTSIPTFMPSLIFYILLLMGYMYLLTYLADYFIGKPDEVINGLAALKSDQDAIINFLSTLPKDVIDTIIKRSAFLYLGSIVYLVLMLYSVPALYFSSKPNPFIGLKNAVLAFIKKPLGSFFLFLGLAICHIALIFFEAISVLNSGLMFVALILRISFITYVVVLIFSVYESNFTLDCNNGGNGLGENKTCS